MIGQGNSTELRRHFYLPILRLSPNEPSAETLEQAAEPGREVEKEVEMFGCAIEGEGQC